MSKKPLPEKLEIDLLEACEKDLPSLALLYGVDEDFLRLHWTQMQSFGRLLRETAPEPSQIVINRILAHAREAKKEPAFYSWFLAFRPFRAVVVALFFVVTVFYFNQKMSDQNQKVATRSFAAPNFDFSKKEKLDYYAVLADVQYSFLLKNNRPSVQKKSSLPVSGYETVGQHFSFSDVQDQSESLAFQESNFAQSLLKEGLSADEAKTLYWRARKLEHWKEFDLALRDYLILAQALKVSEQEESLPLSIANCLEKLGQKQQGISVLEAYKGQRYSSQSVDERLDELKSESF